jgi:hypothetical protein
MRLDQGPVFRKVIIPWYDSDIAGLIMIAFLLVVMTFGFIGIAVARDHPQWQAHGWFPVLLVTLCAVVIASAALRLLKRLSYRYSG